MSPIALPTHQSISIGDPSSASVQSPPVPPNSPLTAMTLSSGTAPFDQIKKYLSNKPLRIRVPDDPKLNEFVRYLAKQWLSERPRGTDIHDMIESPSYRQIVNIGPRAIRPLLLLLRENPDHWFPALNAITGETPVPAISEGRVKEMANAWIKWGKEHGYLGSMD